MLLNFSIKKALTSFIILSLIGVINHPLTSYASSSNDDSSNKKRSSTTSLDEPEAKRPRITTSVQQSGVETLGSIEVEKK